jgi:excisionase family DNA binding protein
MGKQTIVPGEWYPSEEAAQRLNISLRTLQKWAEKGHLKFKTIQQGSHRFRVYDAADVDRLRESGPPEPRPQPQKPEPDLVITKQSKAELQAARALDTVSIVGNLVASHKSEMEMLVAQMGRNLEAVVNMILTAQKAEADANRERLKAEREDARERWEIERQDRLERRKNRSAGANAASGPRAIVGSH